MLLLLLSLCCCNSPLDDLVATVCVLDVFVIFLMYDHILFIELPSRTLFGMKPQDSLNDRAHVTLWHTVTQSSTEQTSKYARGLERRVSVPTCVRASVDAWRSFLALLN